MIHTALGTHIGSGARSGIEALGKLSRGLEVRFLHGIVVGRGGLVNTKGELYVLDGAGKPCGCAPSR